LIELEGDIVCSMREFDVGEAVRHSFEVILVCIAVGRDGDIQFTDKLHSVEQERM